MASDLDFDVAELVHRCYERVRARKGITKGFGSAVVVDAQEVTAEVVAEVGILWQREQRKIAKALKANGKRIRRLAEAHGVQVPGPVEIQKGLVDLDLQRTGLKLADRNLPDSDFYPGHSVSPGFDGN